MENNLSQNNYEKAGADKLINNIYEFVSVIVSAVIVIFFVFVFVIRVLVVSGESMLPTLNHADSVAISSAARSFEYGDIVIVAQPNAMHKTLIKRVIAVGGQKVDIDETAGVVYVDDQPLTEHYTLAPTYTKGDMEYPVYVPEGCLFVMGDNRNDSTDSRYSQVGLIYEKYIVGRVIFRLHPFGNWRVE